MSLKGTARKALRDPQVEQLAADMAATKDLVAQINHNVTHLLTVVSELQQRSGALDEVATLARHLNTQASGAGCARYR
jgi:hypothetical protein